MSLPQLYKDLTLTSYDKIRYREEEPEGMGSASPFSMGLNAVITRPYATLVRSMTLRGDWREHELEEHARVGRVPDSSMMLNIAVRAAVDRMTDLESFSWELNTKMLETVYMGLAQLPRLTSLNIRFPSSRHPRPTIVIPPMPHLRRLKVTDIDPLCYPDDISTLLWKSKKLRELNMHWSPRMRNAQEPSVMLHDYFRKCIAAKEPMKVKKIVLQNLYALHSEEFNVAFDPRTVEEVTILNNTGSDGPNFMNTFVDRSWPTNPPNERLRIKCMRQDALSKRHAEFIANFTGLEKLYFVNTPRDANDFVNSPVLTPPSSDNSHPATANSPVGSPASSSNVHLNLRDNYLNAIVTNHCATLRHLLLPSRWPLSASTLARIVHASPQLEQLAFASDFPSMDTLGLILPFLRKLVALRLLVPTNSVSSPGSSGTGASSGTAPRPTRSITGSATNWFPSARSLVDIVELDDQFLMEKMSGPFSDRSVFGRLRMFGMGRKAWELQDFYTVSDEELQQQQPPAPAPAAAAATTTEESNGNHTISELPTTSHIEHEEPYMTMGISSPNSLHSTNHNQPSSILGKRSREEEPPWSPSKNRRPPSPFMNGNGNGNDDEPECMSLQIAPDTHRWRRRMRRVGWEVLQHWEIWALDKQDA